MTNDDLTLLKTLKQKERRGSKPRCHFLTHGPRSEVARRLTGLAAPFAQVTEQDTWMPTGFADVTEAQLHKATALLDPHLCKSLGTWWLSPASVRARTPNFDIASTCTIDGRRGLLLVEAKAHDEELAKEAPGRRLDDENDKKKRNGDGSAQPSDRALSHDQIGKAIEEARVGLEGLTSLPWRIGRDTHYQMSNRFAWAWKLTELGIPVVLVYLGFLRATEMADRGAPFQTQESWRSAVLAHSAPLFDATVWDRAWSATTGNGTPLVPLIRSCEEPLPAA